MNESSNVITLQARDRSDARFHAQRTQALFGPAPMFTFALDEQCLSVRLVSAFGGRWLGLVADKASFTDRVRLTGGQLTAPFVVHANASTPTVCGEAAVEILGKVGPGGELPPGLQEELSGPARALVEAAPFGAHGQVLITVEPGPVRVDEGETPAHGAVPRT